MQTPPRILRSSPFGGIRRLRNMGLVRRNLMALMLLLACLVGISQGDYVAVTLEDGKQYEGELVGKSADVITIKVRGRNLPVPRTRISKVEPRSSPAEEYALRREKLKDDDLNGRYKLSYWLYERGLYRLAQSELKGLRQQFPDDQRVITLAGVIEKREKLESKKSEDSSGADKSNKLPVTSGVSGSNGASYRNSSQRLTRKQLNLIRLFEIDLKLKPVVQISSKTIRKVLDEYAGDDPQLLGARNQKRFLSLRNHEQLAIIFELSQTNPEIRSLYSEVVVKTDPPALRTFRTKIHKNYVINYCGTAGCHGGSKAGKLFLFRTKPISDETVYTNFFILDSHRSAGKFDLIDRGQPKNSLLIQYGLPRSAASEAHPEVDGWQPNFRRRNDPRIKMMEDWIRSLYSKRPPNYLIKFDDLGVSRPQDTESPTNTPLGAQQ